MRRLPSALIASRMPLWVLPVVLLLQQLRSCLRSAGQADWIAAAESAEEEAVPAVKGVKNPGSAWNPDFGTLQEFGQPIPWAAVREMAEPPDAEAAAETDELRARPRSPTAPSATPAAYALADESASPTEAGRSQKREAQRPQKRQRTKPSA